MMDDKALEEKARGWLSEEELIGTWPATLAALLREVAEEARREAEAEVARLRAENREWQDRCLRPRGSGCGVLRGEGEK
jgi:hypothetical protein